MREAVLTGAVRKTGRKGPARRLRAQGLLPGVVYGSGDPLPVTVSAKELGKLLELKGGKNRVINATFEGDGRERKVLIKALDVHPIYDTLLHVDLWEVDLHKPVRVTVALELVGVPRGVKEQGGVLATNIRSLWIECLPADIPAVIETSITGLENGQSLWVKDLALNENIKVLTDPDILVAAVSMPKVEEAPVEGEEEIEAAAAASPKPAAEAE